MNGLWVEEQEVLARPGGHRQRWSARRRTNTRGVRTKIMPPKRYFERTVCSRSCPGVAAQRSISDGILVHQGRRC